MSYRIHCEIVDHSGDHIFSDQILGNNDFLCPEHLKRLGIEFCEDDLWFEEQEVDLEILLDVFKEHFINKLEEWSDEDITQVFDSLKDPKGTFHSSPSWTVIGNYAIVVDRLIKYSNRMKFRSAPHDVYTTTLSGG